MNLPTWVWYLIGGLIFIAAYLYLQSSRYQTTNPIGGKVVVPDTQDLANYNGDVEILTQLLQSTHDQLAAHPPIQKG